MKRFHRNLNIMSVFTAVLLVFGLISFAAFLLSVGISIPIILTFLETGLVPRFPTAVLSVGIMLISFLSLTCVIILNGITQARTEMKKLHYLEYFPRGIVKAFHAKIPEQAEKNTVSS